MDFDPVPSYCDLEFYVEDPVGLKARIVPPQHDDISNQKYNLLLQFSAHHVTLRLVLILGYVLSSAVGRSSKHLDC
jgi:hypothetical protein